MRVIDADTGKPFQLYMSDELQRELNELAATKNCLHEKTEIRRCIVRGGAIQHRNQCLRCGELVGTTISRSKVPPNTPDEDTETRRRLESAYNEARAIIIQRHVRLQKNRNGEFWEAYNAYLQSPEWRTKRDRVLKRAGGTCEGCGERPAAQVHHLTYKHVFNEFLFELVAVCDGCHGRLHEGEVEEPDDDGQFEKPCAGCRYQSEYKQQDWCGKFDLPAIDALGADGPCGPTHRELEPLK